MDKVSTAAYPELRS